MAPFGMDRKLSHASLQALDTRPPSSLSKASRPRPRSLQPRRGASLALELAQVVSEAIFDFSRLVEAARHQCFEPVLGGGSPQRSDAGIPPGAEFQVRRQARVDEALGRG